MRVYTFTLPKFVSGIVRKCADIFRKDEQSKTIKATKTTKTASRKRKKKQEKTPS